MAMPEYSSSLFNTLSWWLFCQYDFYVLGEGHHVFTSLNHSYTYSNIIDHLLCVQYLARE